MKTDEALKGDAEKQEVAPVDSSLDNELNALEAEAAPDQQAIVETEKKQEQVSSAKDEYYGVLKIALTPLPALMCPNWDIQPQEIEALCEAYAVACAKQWPDGMEEMGPWVGAALTTVVVVAPRLAIPPRPPKKQLKGGSSDGSTENKER